MTTPMPERADTPARAARKPKAADGAMPLTGHLRELRRRITLCLVTLAAGFGVSLALAPRLVTLFTGLGAGYGYRFVYIAPQELLMVYFSIALLGGVVLSAPVLAWQLYAFCQPGLKKAERWAMLGALTAGAAFFCTGVAFAWFVSVPFMLFFLIGFSAEVGIAAAISIEQYIHFVLTVFVIFGVVFELPVLSVLLTGLGLLKPQWMVKGRRVMVVVVFLVAAVITPPDVVSQVMVAVPMLGLYELSILLSRLCLRLKNRRPQKG